MKFFLRGVRSTAGEILRGVPIVLWRQMRPKINVGVCYHMVSDETVPHVKHYRFLDKSSFESDLDYLCSRFNFVDYEQVVRVRSSRRPVKDNAVILTFDDGFAECETVVAPLLRQRGLHCVFFVISDLIDNRKLFVESAAALCVDAIMRQPINRVISAAVQAGLSEQVREKKGDTTCLRAPITLPYGLVDLGVIPDGRLRPLLRWLLQASQTEEAQVHSLLELLGVKAERYLQTVQPYLTSEQLRRLHADGFTIGAHSCSHRRLQNLSRDEAEYEIVESCRSVCNITGQSSAPFAFPYFGGDLDRNWLSSLRDRHNFIGLYFDTAGVRDDEPFVVQRVFGERFGSESSLDAILRRAWARPAP